MLLCFWRVCARFEGSTFLFVCLFARACTRARERERAVAALNPPLLLPNTNTLSLKKRRRTHAPRAAARGSRPQAASTCQTRAPCLRRRPSAPSSPARSSPPRRSGCLFWVCGAALRACVARARARVRERRERGCCPARECARFPPPVGAALLWKTTRIAAIITDAHATHTKHTHL